MTKFSFTKKKNMNYNPFLVKVYKRCVSERDTLKFFNFIISKVKYI